MAFSAEIRARLGLDTTTFNTQLQAVPGSLERVGMKAQSVIARTFSLSNVFKGFLSGLGIGSALAMINKVSGAISDSIEHAGRLSLIFDGIAANARAASEAIARVGKGEGELLEMLGTKLDTLKKKRDDLLADTGSKSFFGGLIEKGSALDKLFGFSRDEEITRAEKLKKLNQEIGQTVVETAQKKETISKKAVEEDLRGQMEIAKNDRERAEAAKKLADFEKTRRREKLGDEELIRDLQTEQLGVNKQIAAYVDFIKQGGQLTADGNRDLLELKVQQAEIEKDILAATERRAAAEQKVGEVLRSNIAEWRQFQIEINTTGRGDRELSDRELARKADEIKRDIAARELALQTSGSVFTGGVTRDPLLAGSRSNLGQLLAEQDLRTRVRRDVAAFGEEEAFRRNPGLTERRFAEITRGLTDNEKFISELEKLRREQERSLQAIAETLKSIR